MSPIRKFFNGIGIRQHFTPSKNATSMLKKRQLIQYSPEAIEQGYKSCRARSKRFCKSYLWIASNLPGPDRNAVETLICHLFNCLELLDLASPNRLPLDVWSEIRDDLSDAFLDKCTSNELAALVDTARKYEIPKQFLFDPVESADTWIRNRKFDTWEELKVFTMRFGGSFVAAAIPILGAIKPDYKIVALRCGQAIMLTQILAECVRDLKQNKNFLALEDIEECEVDIDRIKMRQFEPAFEMLVLLYCDRIEKIFHQAGNLIGYLDYDGVRTIKSLLSVHWKMLNRMRLDPESILVDKPQLTFADRVGLRSRHLLGMEGNIPIFPNQEHH